MQDRTHSFGYWLRRRRRALDLTQAQLAQRVSCSGFSIRKIEADERRPSRRLAERLAASLAIPEEERREFLDAARASRASEGLRLDAEPVGSSSEQPLGSAVRSLRDVTPFVGRSNEYGLLTGLIARLKRGAGHIVLIEGEPGIGKSRLLRELAQHAKKEQLPTLATNCYEIERAMPYQPVMDLIRRALDCVSAASLQALAPVSLAELAALVPEVRERVPGLPHLSNDFPEARQARLPHAVGQLLDTWRAGGPSLVIVDDIQWADDASAQVLHYLARQTSERSMLVIYAYRDEAVDGDERFARLTESLRRDTGARRVPLSRLSSADTSSLVAALAESSPAVSELAPRLHRETDGNPFFLISILQSVIEGETELATLTSEGPGLLPDALRAAVRVRLSHVPQEFRPILETAAVLGRRFDFDTLLDVTGEREEPLLAALETLVKRRLLREEAEGGVYDFSHDKVREVVYRDIGEHGAGASIDPSPRRSSAAPTANPMNSTHNSPNITNAPTCGRKRCAICFSPPNTRRGCLLCAMPYTGSIARSRFPSPSHGQSAQAAAWRSTHSAERHAHKRGRHKARSTIFGASSMRPGPAANGKRRATPWFNWVCLIGARTPMKMRHGA